MAGKPEYIGFIGIDRSNQPGYHVPRNAVEPYTSTLIGAIDGIDRLFIYYPVFQQNGSFIGWSMQLYLLKN